MLNRPIQTTRLMIPMFLLALLQACSSGMSKEECGLANWQQIGFEDGSVGHNLNYISRHRKSCAKAGVAPDFTAYKRGHAEGLKLWCNYDNGLHFGESGRRYEGICPKNLEADFLDGYNYGTRLHQARSLVSGIRNDIANGVHQIEDLKQERINLGELIVDSETSSVDRLKYVTRIKDIGDEITGIELFLADKDIELQRAETELQRVRP